MATQVDKILLSIFQRAFKSITDEMSISLTKTTRSPILCEAKDFVTGLYDAEGGVHDVQVWVHSQGGREKQLAVGF